MTKSLFKEKKTKLEDTLRYLFSFVSFFGNSDHTTNNTFPGLSDYFQRTTSIAPLVVYRILFGAVMFASIIRFISKGWVYDLYIKPKFYFSYFGFEWIKPLGATGMYIVFGSLALLALLVMAGLFYRFSIASFFLLFTYVELIDKTNYLNHYYFVSIVSFLLILVPANKYFSLDAWFYPKIKTKWVPQWSIDIFKFQIAIVYLYAGLAKLNYDWLFRAMPLRIWLPAQNDFPLLGPLFEYTWIAFAFSWFGAVYDLTIPFLLINKRTRPFGFFLVLVFHLLTVSLFQIGMFPYIMILGSLIFFSADFHKKIISFLSKAFPANDKTSRESDTYPSAPSLVKPSFPQKLILGILVFHFALQILIPLRFLLYPGKLFWTEQGYRFSWRVMLMEKAGVAFFYVKDKTTGDEWEVTNRDFLTINQEKMVATQPDMILQFAKYLKEYYQKQGIENPEVRAKTFVTLNGRASRPIVDETIDLALEKESLKHKNWVTSF
ncbi:MAG TPA: HTTM domain-containing protein [Cytophagales bacterium]|nr:HTTM domain-containing protein [Cytophagales bacterium]